MAVYRGGTLPSVFDDLLSLSTALVSFGALSQSLYFISENGLHNILKCYKRVHHVTHDAASCQQELLLTAARCSSLKG